MTAAAFDDLGLSLCSHLDLARAGQLPETGDDVHALLLEEAGQTANQTLNRLILSCQGRRPIETRLFGDHAELSGVGNGVEDIGDVEPLFGGDATADEAGASRALLVDHGDREPEVVGVQSGGVSTWTAANYDDVVQR